jgi:parallel beta-helix repeat protein
LIDTCDSDTILDGFIITDGLKGIYAEDSSAIITNCIIADNSDDGITCIDSDIEVSWSIIKNNVGTGADGIYIQGSTSNPVIFNCKIRDNEAHGINVSYGYPTIKNSWIHHNDCGIYLSNPSSAATIRNNTICDNYQEGIMRTGGTAANVSNCILWDNDMSGDEIQITLDTPTYSCIYDPNTSSSTPDETYHNITANPMFAYPDPDLNNFHLAPDSPCEDKGQAEVTPAKRY